MKSEYFQCDVKSSGSVMGEELCFREALSDELSSFSLAVILVYEMLL